MSVLDWISLYPTIKDGKLPDWFSGQLNVTLGDSLFGFYGSRQVDVLGADTRLVLDLENLIATRVFPSMEMLVSGIGGNALFCYGSSMSAVYGGVFGQIRRSPQWKKSADSATGPFEFDGPGGPSGAPNAVTNLYPPDTAVRIAVVALSTLLCGIVGAIDLGIKIGYWKLGSATDASVSAAGQKTIALLTTLRKLLAPRLMAMIEKLEQACSVSQFAKQFLQAALWIPGALLGLTGALFCALGALILSPFSSKCPRAVMTCAFAAIDCLEFSAKTCAGIE